MRALEKNSIQFGQKHALSLTENIGIYFKTVSFFLILVPFATMG